MKLFFPSLAWVAEFTTKQYLQRETRTLIIQDNNMLVCLCEILPYTIFCVAPITPGITRDLF